MDEFPSDLVSPKAFPLPRHRLTKQPSSRGASRRGSMDSLPEEDVTVPSKPAQAVATADEFSPTKWNQYWDNEEDIFIEGRGTFRVYSAGSGPLLFCLHGGGYTGLTWSLVAQLLKDSCRIVALDLRGHGGTRTEDDLDLSIQTLAADVVEVWRSIAGNNPPPTVIVGHSMGGAVAVRAAGQGELSSLQGVIVIDVVEGTALASLPAMRNVVCNRPSSFTSLEAAVKWAVKAGMSRNAEAAAVSVPSMLLEEGALRGSSPADMTASLGGIAEEEQVDGADEAPAEVDDAPLGLCRFIWRTPLLLSEPYWRGWYEGLSESFLKLHVPKVLILAGTDRLDKTLTIGQMQGKFQLVLLPMAGHAVQEDEPQRTADAILHFFQRFRVGQGIPLIPAARPGDKPVLAGATEAAR